MAQNANILGIWTPKYPILDPILEGLREAHRGFGQYSGVGSDPKYPKIAHFGGLDPQIDPNLTHFRPQSGGLEVTTSGRET